MNIIGQRDLKPCPFCGHEPMSGEVRPATRKSPPLFGIALILANIFELRSEMGKIGEK